MQGISAKAARSLVDFLLSAGKRVFTHTELVELIEHPPESQITRSNPLAPVMDLTDVLHVLLEHGHIERHEFSSMFRCGPRYTLGQASIYELLQSLKPKGYLSHHSAAQIHGLAAEEAIDVYWNDEQSPKPRPASPPDQGRIDLAFQRPPRITANRGRYRDQGICILNGMHTDRLGVMSFELPECRSVPVTDLERTLIDITVRPIYAGGPHHVLRCYKSAGERISITRLLELLKRLNYAYPYHQAIGFYLSRTGAHDTTALTPIRSLSQEFKFYLANQMRDQAYCEEWKIYYPADL